MTQNDMTLNQVTRRDKKRAQQINTFNYGVLTAVGDRETKVRVRVPGINAEGEEVVLETFTTITAISIALAFGLRRKKV